MTKYIEEKGYNTVNSKYFRKSTLRGELIIEVQRK